MRAGRGQALGLPCGPSVVAGGVRSSGSTGRLEHARQRPRAPDGGGRKRRLSVREGTSSRLWAKRARGGNRAPAQGGVEAAEVARRGRGRWRCTRKELTRLASSMTLAHRDAARGGLAVRTHRRARSLQWIHTESTAAHRSDDGTRSCCSSAAWRRKLRSSEREGLRTAVVEPSSRAWEELAPAVFSDRCRKPHPAVLRALACSRAGRAREGDVGGPRDARIGGGGGCSRTERGARCFAGHCRLRCCARAAGRAPGYRAAHWP